MASRNHELCRNKKFFRGTCLYFIKSSESRFNRRGTNIRGLKHPVMISKKAHLEQHKKLFLEDDNMSTENTTPDIPSTVEEMNNEQYIAALNDLRASTVSRDAYNKLRAENKQLLDALVSGQEIPQKPEEKPSVADLRKRLFSADCELSNLDFVETSLALRDALIESGERDPFLPYGDRVDLTTEQIETANKVAAGLREMVDFADGDSGVFTAQYQRLVKDVSIPRARR